MVKRYLKEHLKAKKGKRIVLEKIRPDSPEEKKSVLARDNVKISVVAEAKEKMRNKIVRKEKQRSLKSKLAVATKVKAVNRVVERQRLSFRSGEATSTSVTPVSSLVSNAANKAVSDRSRYRKSRTVSKTVQNSVEAVKDGGNMKT